MSNNHAFVAIGECTSCDCESCDGKGGGWASDKGPLPSDGIAWIDCPDCGATGIGPNPVLHHFEQIADELFELGTED